MLETVRAFVAERLAARPDAGQIGRRHADYYRALAGQADRPLRTGQGEWLARLDAEAGNLADAVRRYLAHDHGPLPHLFRVLCLFWVQADLEREAWSWVHRLLPAADTLDPQARAELAWAAAVVALDIGDDTAALAARQRLAPLLTGIQDPFLHATSQLALAWTLPITGDFDGALREVTVALEELRAQDEPVFTALAAFTAGTMDIALDRYDDALRHLREARDLAERSGGDWLTAGPRVQLAILAVLRGSLEEARGAAGGGAGAEPGRPQYPVRDLVPGRLCPAGVRRRRPGAGGAAGRRGRGPAPAGRPAGVAGSAPGGGRSGGPSPPTARRQPVRSGVLRRLPAHPAGGGRHRLGPARHRDPGALSRTTAQKPRLGASCGGEPAPAPRCRPSPPGERVTSTGNY